MNIAFIAHDRKKDEMVNFVIAYEHVFKGHNLYSTGTTGTRIMEQTNLIDSSVHVGTAWRRSTNRRDGCSK